MNTAKASTTAPASAPLTVIHVPFHGDSLDAVQDGGKVFVPVKRVSEALGLDFSSQLKRLNRQAWAVVVMMATTASDGKTYETACLDLDSLPMWLATVDVKRVSPAAREKLVVYQRECAKVLREHFFGTGETEAAKSSTGAARLNREQFAYYFGPQLAAKPHEGNSWTFGHHVRKAIGLDDESDRSDSTQFLKSIQVELSLIELALEATSKNLARSESDIELIHSAVYLLRNRVAGIACINENLQKAHDLAKELHVPSKDPAVLRAAWDKRFARYNTP